MEDSMIDNNFSASDSFTKDLQSISEDTNSPIKAEPSESKEEGVEKDFMKFSNGLTLDQRSTRRLTKFNTKFKTRLDFSVKDLSTFRRKSPPSEFQKQIKFGKRIQSSSASSFGSDTSSESSKTESEDRSGSQSTQCLNKSLKKKMKYLINPYNRSINFA